MQKTYRIVVSPQKPISITKIGEARWRGNINTLKWDKAEAIATEISELIKSCFVDVAAVVDAEFAAEDNQLISGLIIQLMSEQDLALEPVLTSFLSQITDTSDDQDFFLSLEERLRSVVCNYSEEFLQRLGGKNVGVPLTIEGDGFKFRIAGKFVPLPRSLPHQHSSFTIRAEINGFMKDERILSLRSKTDSTLISTTFDLHEFMRKIAEAALHDTVHDFTIRPMENEKGELRNTLVSISAALAPETLC